VGVDDRRCAMARGGSVSVLLAVLAAIIAACTPAAGQGPTIHQEARVSVIVGP
jgi:hypothetical protein